MSSRSAMITPPIMVIGRGDEHRARQQHQHLHLLHVVGVPGDQGRRAEPVELAGRERQHPVEDGAPDVPAEAHGDLGAEVGGGDRADDLQQADREHGLAGTPDEAGVALGHALVDDRRVQARQEEGGHGADQRQHDHHADQPTVGRQIAAEQADQHPRPPVVGRGEDAVQHQVHDLLRFGKPVLADDGVGQRKGHGPQGVGGLDRVEAQTVAIGLEQRGDRGVELLVVGSLTRPEAVGIVLDRRAQPHGVEQREHPLQPGLQDADGRDQPLLDVLAEVDLGELVAGVLDVEHVLQHGVDQGLLGREGPKDRALGDVGGLGDLSGADLAAELLEQRLGGGDQCGPAFVGGQGGRAGHPAHVVSEHSLSKGLSEIGTVTCLSRSRTGSASWVWVGWPTRSSRPSSSTWTGR